MGDTYGDREQPDPVPNAGQSVWRMVLADMAARERLGFERYGVPVLAFNGRDALADAYAEALDLCVYLRQAIAERDASRAEKIRDDGPCNDAGAE